MKSKTKIRNFTDIDLQRIVEEHIVVYKNEYGFDNTFRSYVEDAIIDFKKNFTKGQENIWIAEMNNKFVGSIAIVRTDEDTAQLRWFLIKQQARGRGLGNKMMKTVIEFCQKEGYGHIFLWTISFLDAARHLYEKYGFKLTDKKEHEIWGKYLVEERWDYYINS